MLLRESFREGQRVRKRTLANLTEWPEAKIEGLRAVLAGASAVGSLEKAFTIERSRPHGHVAAVVGTLKQLGLDRLLASRRSVERDRAVALVAARVLDLDCKLATARALSAESATTLGELVGLATVEADQLYAALDWLGERQAKVETRSRSAISKTARSCSTP